MFEPFCEFLESLQIIIFRRNFFAGSPLNRLSWLRPSHPFLNAIIVSPATRWLIFDSGRPLVVVNSSDPSKQNLAYLTTDDVKPLLGSEPFFGQGKDEGQLVIESNEVRHSPTEAARHRHARIVFLGLDEQSNSNALPSSDFVDPGTAIDNLEGTPYFCMDVAELELTPEQLKDALDGTSQGQKGQIFSWSEPRVLMTGLDRFPGAVFAEARSLVDWNLRNKVRLPQGYVGVLDIYVLFAVLPFLWLPYILDVGWLENLMLLFTAMGR